MVSLKARCLCGAVRIAVEGDIHNMVHCHCESCRRATSSPVTTFVIVKKADCSITGSHYSTYASSPGVERGFCARCGSPLSYAGSARPDQIDLYAASLESDEWVSVKSHYFWEERVSWLNMVDDLEKH